MLNNKLAKLIIDAYSDKERKSKIGSFEGMFNPPSLALSYTNQYSSDSALNASASEAIYISTESSNLDLELIIDTSSIYKNVGEMNVKEKVEEFFKLFVMNGDIHQPPFLKIYWGEMQWVRSSNNSTAFDCRIASVNVTYSLFARNGTPLRATLNTKFIQDISNEIRINSEKKNSPDLTHTRIVTSSSNIPLFAHQIYQDPLLYLKIAKDNDLDSFRDIKPGMILNFQPISDEMENII